MKVNEVKISEHDAQGAVRTLFNFIKLAEKGEDFSTADGKELIESVRNACEAVEKIVLACLK